MEALQVREAHTVVVGSGAAGFNAADRLHQYGVEDVIVVTEAVNAGTSRNTGSDKQTYYKLSLAGGQEDSVRRLARVLYDGGCVDGEHALCEAALSCQGFFKLVELGVPFPHSQYGEFVGYKTDHDPNDRGTSAGPYTSRYMTEALERAVREKGIPIYDHYQVIRILTDNGKVYGLLCLDKEQGEYTVIKCVNVVYATGGPAGMYRDSVYPASQSGASGIAFEAGVLGKNLTEWQYGLASLKPRWNVSGSYMQVLPCLISTDAEGNDRREFLMEFYKTREEMMDMIFLKGYQWPFDCGKVSGGSSMIDLLVYGEICVRGRRVWLDYRYNPGGEIIDFQALAQETREYLENAGACQETPYERLCQLNGPAAAFYLEHGIDLSKEMLEVAVCAQHNNGGLSVNEWWQTNIEGLFAVGEAAGTHGIYRPGGSALNAGQAGSTRAARYIGAHRDIRRPWAGETRERLMNKVREWIAMGEAACWLPDSGRETVSDGKAGVCHEKAADSKDFGHRWKQASGEMSRYGAMLRDRRGMEQMSREIETELRQLAEEGSRHMAGEERFLPQKGNQKLAAGRSRFYRYVDMRICQKVYLDAMMDYQTHGGKSRGSAIYMEEPGGDGEGAEQVVLELAVFSLDGPDGKAHGGQIQEMAYNSKEIKTQARWRGVHPLDDIEDGQAFEVVWKAYREGGIFG